MTTQKCSTSKVLGALQVSKPKLIDAKCEHVSHSGLIEHDERLSSNFNSEPSSFNDYDPTPNYGPQGPDIDNELDKKKQQELEMKAAMGAFLKDDETLENNK
jgi:hypothetical protein